MDSSQDSRSVVGILGESLIYALMAVVFTFALDIFTGSFMALALASILVFSLDASRSLFFSGKGAGFKIKTGAVTLVLIALAIAGVLWLLNMSALFVVVLAGVFMLIARGWDSGWSSFRWAGEIASFVVSGYLAIICLQWTNSTFLLFWSFFLVSGTISFILFTNDPVSARTESVPLKDIHTDLSSQIDGQFERAERQAINALRAMKVH